MDPKKKLPLSFNNNIHRNLFQKTYSFSENRKYSSKERQKCSEEQNSKPKTKQIKSFIYFQKIPAFEDKKEETFLQNTKILIDSKTDGRLPNGYIDISYDNPINE